MWGGTITQSRLQQAIHQLSTLNKVPGRTRENTPNVHETPHRQLSIAREREITSNLAFLSSASDDPLKVTAVCSEEHRDGKGITIRIASNTGDLVAGTRGLQLVAGSLERAASRVNSRSEDTDFVLNEVVDLASPRILGRLRSRHAKVRLRKIGKPMLARQLSSALSDNSINIKQDQKRALRDTARADAAALQVVVEKLESISNVKVHAREVRDALCQIVKLAYEFSQSHNLIAIFETSKMNPSTVEHLQEAVCKLGRYYSAANELVCAARDKTSRVLLQSILVQSFAAQRPQSQDVEAFRVHAEIQLLFFYEQNPQQPRPRVISSSKSACFLCNLFFEVHGAYHVPRTHGRLYEKWTLPDWLAIPQAGQVGLRRVVFDFHEAINEVIQTCLKARSKPYPDPRESALLPLATWPPSSGASRAESLRGSTLTVQRPPFNARGKMPVGKSPLHRELPPSPPTTTPQSASLAAHEDDHPTSPSPIDADAVILAHARTNSSPVSTTPSSISLHYEQLPYTQAIHLTIPSFQLRLNTLHLTFIFDHVLSGHISISSVGDRTLLPARRQDIDVHRIPTDSERQLTCEDECNRLDVVLTRRGGGLILIGFFWDESSNA